MPSPSGGTGAVAAAHGTSAAQWKGPPLREQDRQEGPGRGPARSAVPRGASPLVSLAGIDSAATVTPQQALALQRTAGNAGTARLLAQRGRPQGASEAPTRPQEHADAARPVQRAAARVVQRVPWPDPAAAHQSLLDQGWWVGPDGGYTRAPVPETDAPADGWYAGAAQPGQAAAQWGDQGQAQWGDQGQAAAEAAQQWQAQGEEQGQAAAEDDAVTLRVLVRKNASFRDPDYFDRTGHSWVAFYKGDKFHSSAGFYPVNGEINPDAPHRSVPGEVRLNHDDPAEATTELSVLLTRKQFSKAQKYIHENLNRDYNVVRFNCTDFAIGVYKAATGQSPPGRNRLLPNNPNDLHSGIKKYKKSR